MLVKVGDLIKVRRDAVGYDPYGHGGQIGIITKDGYTTAKVRWLNAKPNKPLESWVHYNRLVRLEDTCN